MNGLTDMGIELCARLVTGPTLILWLVKRQGAVGPEMYRTFGPGTTAVFVMNLPILAPGSNFPYGYAVHPD